VRRRRRRSKVSPWRKVGDLEKAFGIRGGQARDPCAARRAAKQLSIVRKLPARTARVFGYSAAGAAARRVLGGELRREAAIPIARIPAKLAVNATPDGSACGFYGAAFTELLRLLVGYEGAMVHVSCRATGGDRCEWRAAVPDPRHH